MLVTPVLYSYRRCPYAMRARMGLYLAKIQVEQREIVFWDKPLPMLEASPKGTVPVLILQDGRVLEESLDILLWAFGQTDSQDWWPNDLSVQAEILEWIELNDTEFKVHLDRYKYADRSPEESAETYRKRGEVFLEKCELVLQQQAFLVSKHYASLADIAIFPFVRQFANVDKQWWAEGHYPCLSHWLEHHLSEPYFSAVMKNRPVWQLEHQPLMLDEPGLNTRDQFRRKAQA